MIGRVWAGSRYCCVVATGQTQIFAWRQEVGDHQTQPQCLYISAVARRFVSAGFSTPERNQWRVGGLRLCCQSAEVDFLSVCRTCSSSSAVWTVVMTCVSLWRLKVFEASDFGSHPLFSVAQGGVDLQQVSTAAWGRTGARASSSRPEPLCETSLFKT